MKKEKYEFGFIEFLIKTAKKREWANILNILSVSILLNRKILTLTYDKKSFKPSIFKYCVRDI